MPESRPSDGRHHVSSLLMRESLLDKDLVAATDDHRPVVRMLPEARVVKIGGRSIVDRGRQRRDEVGAKIFALKTNPSRPPC
jgi:hypothetical protein